MSGIIPVTICSSLYAFAKTTTITTHFATSQTILQKVGSAISAVFSGTKVYPHKINRSLASKCVYQIWERSIYGSTRKSYTNALLFGIRPRPCPYTKIGVSILQFSRLAGLGAICLAGWIFLQRCTFRPSIRLLFWPCACIPWSSSALKNKIFIFRLKTEIFKPKNKDRSEITICTRKELHLAEKRSF